MGDPHRLNVRTRLGIPVAEICILTPVVGFDTSNLRHDRYR